MNSKVTHFWYAVRAAKNLTVLNDQMIKKQKNYC